VPIWSARRWVPGTLSRCFWAKQFEASIITYATTNFKLSSNPLKMIANQFEYGSDRKTAETDLELSGELRKEKCYQLFVAYKSEHRSIWKGNF